MQPESGGCVSTGIQHGMRREEAMPALLPIILASAHLVLATDRVPQFNIEPSCRAVQNATTGIKRDEAGCRRNEQAARDELQQKWGQFSGADRTHCARLATLGGSPSYVELLTCLEIGTATKNLPSNKRSDSDNERRNNKTNGQAKVEDGGEAGRSINR
jgi:hypothetical protein